ncbi:MAG: amino acid permease [Myxococcota bacterium]
MKPPPPPPVAVPSRAEEVVVLAPEDLVEVEDGSPGGPDESGAKKVKKPVLFGTFTGVFTPTLLTIFGVIMYVRIGWSVGNAGVLGTWLVMLLAMGITAATGLSLSSIATNTRIGPGGPYAILARSLGMEVGGSIGVPLYLTRPLGVAMYIIGFREGWLWIFPDHPPLAIDLIVFFILSGISYISADLAFRVQYLIMAIIVGSIVSIFASPPTFEPVTDSIPWWGNYAGFPENGFRGTDFWGVFAVFFPATTGILAGANMSGDLKDPRRAIPAGTLWAIGISSVVYFALAWWCARAAPVDELLNNYNVAIDQSLWPPIVLAGLLGATASSALAGLVGGPRILMAMGQNRVIPFSSAMAKASPDGNPRSAIIVTSLLTLACVMVRDLNAIAPIVTMFFLITYCMLNVVVLVESGLGLVSFRPTLRIPRLIPLFGLVGCIFSMFIVNPTFGLVSIGLVVAFYIWISRRGQHEESEDVRSSVFVAVASWAAARVTDEDQDNQRAWKPNLLVPVVDPEIIRGQFELLRDMTSPDGSITLIGVGDTDRDGLRERLKTLASRFRKVGVQSSAAVVHSEDRVAGIKQTIEALQAAFFRPNMLFIPFDDALATANRRYMKVAAELGVGMMIVAAHPKAGFGQRKRVNLWVRPAPGSWDAVDAFSSGNLNLNLLTGFRLLREWRADVRLMTCVHSEDEIPAARDFLRQLADLARLPTRVHREVVVGSFEECLESASIADVNLIGMPPDPDPALMKRWVSLARGSCIFVRDSGRENALV